MDLNRIGSGKKLIKSLMDAGQLKTMNWSKKQQLEELRKHKNPHNAKTRNLKK